jgi:hypothetical protein
MIRFHGKCQIIQYMPKKLIKFGFKVFSLCDSETKYLYNFTIYRCKERDENAENSLPMDVVLGLVSGLRYKGYIVYLDSWYAQFLYFKN